MGRFRVEQAALTEAQAMELKLSEARVRGLARIEAEAGDEVEAGDGWDHELARSIMDGKATTETSVLLFVIHRDEVEQYRWRCTVASGNSGC